MNITSKSTASCQPPGQNCQYAIDGNRYSTKWRYIGAAVGAWLKIEFDRTYDVSLLQISLSYWAKERNFKDIKLFFSDGNEQVVSEGSNTDILTHIAN